MRFFDKHYASLVDIIDSNALIKNKKRTYKKLAKNGDKPTRNLLDYFFHYYKLIGIDLSRQTNLTVPHQIDFNQNLKEDNGATTFFSAKMQ